MDFRRLKKTLGLFFSSVGVFLVCLLFIVFFPLLCIGLSKNYSFSCCQFDVLAPWLALPVAVLGFVFSRIFIKKSPRRFASWGFVLLVGFWVFCVVYWGPVEFLCRATLSCQALRFIEKGGGGRRLAIYIEDYYLAPLVIRVRDERKILPFVWRTRKLFFGIGSSVKIKKIKNSRYEVRVYDHHGGEIKLVGRVVWP